LQITLDELKDENDMVDESNGIKVVYRLNLNPVVGNTVIDYQQNKFERGFVIHGPRTSQC